MKNNLVVNYLILLFFTLLIYLLFTLILPSGYPKNYTLKSLLSFFFTFSIITHTIIYKLKKNKFDQIGLLFIGATFVKMLICFFLAKPILENKNYFSAEKNIFLTLFITFLFVETYLVVRVLNKK